MASLTFARQTGKLLISAICVLFWGCQVDSTATTQNSQPSSIFWRPGDPEIVGLDGYSRIIIITGGWQLAIGPDGGGSLIGGEVPGNGASFPAATFDFNNLIKQLHTTVVKETDLSSGDSIVGLFKSNSQPEELQKVNRPTYIISLFSIALQACKSDPDYPNVVKLWSLNPPTTKSSE